MQIITLTTDFGTKDPYVSALKGSIFSALQSINIVDISHYITPFHIMEAAYVIQNAYKNFPKGTIHIIAVDSELTPENKHIAVSLDGHYFIGADNGVISLLANEINPDKIVEINIQEKNKSNFPTLDVFVKVACHIARGGTLEVIGKKYDKLKEMVGIKPVVNNEENQLIGNVIYIDNYGNVITNISKKLFISLQKGRNFTIFARNAQFKVISKSYSDAINFNISEEKREEDGKKIAIWNSSGFLELAIYKSNPKSIGSASTLFGLDYWDTITVNFE